MLHIRTSPLGTPYARDIIPETCHALIQLLPGLMLLLPRAAIAVVVLISFWTPSADVHAPYGGHVDGTADRNPNFFRSDAPGELTDYSKGVLLTFTLHVASRLLVVIASAIGLWVSSGSPLGGLIGKRFRRTSPAGRAGPSTPRKPHRKPSFQPRDPSLTCSPQKNWVDENSWDWAWKERTRARVQDAFELCIVRLDGDGGVFKQDGETRTEQDASWATSSDKVAERIPMGEREQKDVSYSATNFIAQIIAYDSSSSCPPSKIDEFEATRPESILDPISDIKVRPSSSRAGNNPMSSTNDLFYTPPASIASASKKKLSVAEAIGKGGVSLSAYKKPSRWVTEFGVKEEKARETLDSERSDDESGLLSADTSPRQSMLFREWSGSTASHLPHKMFDNVSQHSHSTTSGTGSGSDKTSITSIQQRAYTTSHSHTPDLARARSSSINMIKESLNGVALAAANRSSELVRKARSGTTLNNGTQGKRYWKVSDDEGSEELADDGKWM